MIELVLIGSIPVVLGVVLVLRSLQPPKIKKKGCLDLGEMTDAEYLEHIRTCSWHWFTPYLYYLAGREAERRRQS